MGFASQYYYIGGNTADVSSWVEAVANPDHLWHTTTTIYEVGNPDIAEKSRTYQAASALPASGDVLMFIEKLTMIDKDGNVFGYATGMLTADTMESIVNQTMTGVRAG